MVIQMLCIMMILCSGCGSLDSSNKGMQRMGWKGAGLGAEETGIVEPVKGGEVRDRADMYRGMGNSQVGKQLGVK